MNADMKSVGAESAISRLRVDGGASANSLLMQIQADLSAITVLRSSNAEATATGAAFLAGLAVGFFKDRDELRALLGNTTEFSSSITEEERAKRLDGWHRAVRACREFTNSEE